MRKSLALLFTLILLILPQTVAASSLSGSTDSSGRATILTVHDLTAGAWFDAAITVDCLAPEGEGTSAIKDGFYLWRTRYDSDGNFVSAGYIGNAWQGCNGSTERTYHQQLVLQGATVTVEIVVDRRAWPFGGSKSVGGDLTRSYSGWVTP